jgi:hypothetical protein
MKNLVTVLSAFSLSLTAFAAPQMHPPYGAGLSRCEQDIVASMGEIRAQAWWKSAATGVASGAVAGGVTFAAGSTLEALGSSSEVAGAALFGTGISDPKIGGLVISAVATGVVIGTFDGTAVYADYRETVAKQEALLQLFKDVRNNGMGPMIDIRVAAIQKMLQKFKSKTAAAMRKATGVDFNDQSLSDEEIRLALIQTVSEAASSKMVNCQSPEELSTTIDKATMRSVVEKFNPALSVKNR